jgi:hypothetical protein
MQFVQRIAVDYHLSPLNLDETERYINHRLVAVGGTAGLFDPAACRFIHYQSHGVPRIINSICDTALVYGYASGETQISVHLVFDMVIERVSAGLFGAGVLDFEELGAGDPNQLRKRALDRARLRAASYLRRATSETAIT